jgi:hypothetical protein
MPLKLIGMSAIGTSVNLDSPKILYTEMEHGTGTSCDKINDTS